MRKSLILIGCLLALGWGAACGWAASSATESTPWFARVWQSENGLPENNVTGVAQTRDGYLYVSTHNELVRFDGVRFQPIPVPLPEGRTHPMIRALLHAGENQLWLALDGGVVVQLAPEATNAFTTADGLPDVRPMSLTQDYDHAIWVGYADGSACRIARGAITRFTAREGLPGIGSCWLTSDSAGRLWFAKAGRVGVFRKNRFVTLLTLPERAVRLGTARAGGLWICAGQRLLRYTEGAEPVEKGRLPAGDPEAGPTAVLEERSGALWIGITGNGLFQFDGVRFTAVAVSHGDIECLTEDRENSLWVGTGGGGLNRLRPRVLEVQGRAGGLPFDAVRSACEDSSGTQWIVGENGALVRGREGVWQTVLTNQGWPNPRVSCVVSDEQGGVWIGTSHSGLYRWDEKGFRNVLGRAEGVADDIIRALLPDSAGDLWLGLEAGPSLQCWHQGHLQRYGLPPRSRTVRALVEDAAHRIWAGTVDGHLLRIDGEFLVDETPRTLRPPRPIRSLCATADGSLWIGYTRAGVGRLREGRFTRISQEQGLPDVYICAILPDNGGNLWFASDHGIFRVRQRELDAVADGRAERIFPTSFGRNEGWPNLQGNFGVAPGASRGREGRLLFPMLTGLAVVHPERAQLNRGPLPVRLERVTVDNRGLKLPSAEAALVLPPGQHRIDIDFTALSFVAPESIQFRHRLEGWEEDWVEDGMRRSATYSRLPAGRYRFAVKACNHAGVWGEPTSMVLRVQRFWWQTWWFRFGAGMGLVAGLGLAIRAYERGQVRQRIAFLERQHTIERERARIARDIHDELGAGLAQIGLLADLGASQPADTQQAQTQFSKIASRARAAVGALDEIVWAANPRNDNLPRLADYLCRLADDCFENSTARCRKEVPTGLPVVVVNAELRHNLALSVKEAFVNALKHSRARTVWLRLTWQPPELLVVVQDDGAGFDPASAAGGNGGNGLRHQAERMADIGGTVETRSHPGGGTQVRFRVRLSQEGGATSPRKGWGRYCGPAPGSGPGYQPPIRS